MAKASSDVAQTLIVPLAETVCNAGVIGGWTDASKTSFEDTSSARTVAERWHALMSRPIPAEIKYGKALQRIIGHPASLYVVVEYKDMAAFIDEEFASVVRSPLDAEDWRALQALNRLVACALGHDLDRVPSRDEIQSNIRAFKMSKKAPDVGSVSQACKMAYAALGECLNDEAADAFTQRAAAADDKELTAAWSDMLRAYSSFTDECAQRSPPPANAWTAVPEVARQSLVTALGSADARAWTQVDQMNSYAKISTNIPTGVMSKIETMASKLASDLQNGSITMDSLNLQDIGEKVLSECDAGDLSKLTGNIGELLPVLSQMAPGMAAGIPGGMPAGIPGMPVVPAGNGG